MKSIVKLVVVVLVAVVAAAILYAINEASYIFDFCGKQCIQYIYVRFLAIFVILMITCLVLKFWQGLLTLVLIFFVVTVFMGVYLLVVAPPTPAPPIDPKYERSCEGGCGGWKDGGCGGER